MAVVALVAAVAPVPEVRVVVAPGRLVIVGTVVSSRKRETRERDEERERQARPQPSICASFRMSLFARSSSARPMHSAASRKTTPGFSG